MHPSKCVACNLVLKGFKAGACLAELVAPQAVRGGGRPFAANAHLPCEQRKSPGQQRRGHCGTVQITPTVAFSL